MSSLKRYGLKKNVLIISFTLFLALGLIGISYGAWSDSLAFNMNYRIATAEFEPIVEVYRVEKNPGQQGNYENIVFSEPIRPDSNGVINLSIGPGNKYLIKESQFKDDTFKIYYRLRNESTIPLEYKTIKQNLTDEQKAYVNVSPDEWTFIDANSTSSGNYASIRFRYQKEQGKVVLNPFGLPDVDYAFAKIKIRQSNAGSEDGGWTKNVEIRIYGEESGN